MSLRKFLVLIFICCFKFGFSQTKIANVIIDIQQRIFNAKPSDDHSIETVDSFQKLHLMIAGNVYQTEKHINYAYSEKTGKYDFRNELKYVQPLLNLGDITIANLKTSFANNGANMFSAPDEFALALKYSGINVLTYANVHTANIEKATLKRTRELLNSYDMFQTGAFVDNMQRNGNYPLIIHKKGFKIAILNYTILATRPSISKDFIINELEKTYIERDMRMARANKPDFIIAYFDWGVNTQEIPSAQQMEFAQFAFAQGVNLVIGSHPNAPMRIDYVNYNFNGASKEGIVAYSLGNLIASNDEVKNRNGYLMDIELQKNSFTNETNIKEWGVIPVYTHYDTAAGGGQIKTYAVPCSSVEKGDILPNIAYIEKRRAVNSAYEIRKLVGSVADEIQYNLNELIVNNVQETIDITNASLNNKFNQKREEEIEPSEEPILPIATAGSNNPPSLAILYEQPKKVEPKNQALIVTNTSLINKEKAKVTELFVSKELVKEGTPIVTVPATIKGNTTIPLTIVNKGEEKALTQTVAANKSVSIETKTTTTISQSTTTNLEPISQATSTEKAVANTNAKAITITPNLSAKETSVKETKTTTTISQSTTTNLEPISQATFTEKTVANTNAKASTITPNLSAKETSVKETKTTTTISQSTTTNLEPNSQASSAEKPTANTVAKANEITPNVSIKEPILIDTKTIEQAEAIAAKKVGSEAVNTPPIAEKKVVETKEAGNKLKENKLAEVGNSKAAKPIITAPTIYRDATIKVSDTSVAYSTSPSLNKGEPTIYRTGNNEAPVNTPTVYSIVKPIDTQKPIEREKEKGIDIFSQTPTTVSTTADIATKGDIKSVAQKSLHVQVDTIYQIQFYALKKFIPIDTNYYTHLKGYEVREEGEFFKYFLGRYKSYEVCEKFWKTQILPRYRQSFIVKFLDARKLPEN